MLGYCLSFGSAAMRSANCGSDVGVSVTIKARVARVPYARGCLPTRVVGTKARVSDEDRADVCL
jgi:hypothetical protein